MRAPLLLALLPYVGAQTDMIGYTPGTDVTEHAAIDLDQKEMEDFLDLATPDYTNAQDKFENGGNSLKSSGSYRTIMGFSTNAEERMYNGANYPGVPYKHYEMFYNYYGDFDYANRWVLAAFGKTSTAFSSGRGDANFSAVSDDDTRIEAITKGTSYMHVWMYAIREFEDAIDDCNHCEESCNTLSNNNGVHAWDEGVAFYAGSLEGPDLGGNSAGVMPYRLAEKRCANFRTCGSAADATAGVSSVNTKLFALFEEGRDFIDQGDCSAASSLIDEIVSQMTIPLIQGTLRYAFKVHTGEENTAKAKAEGAVFAASVLPLVYHCDTLSRGKTAETIYDNMKLGATTTDFPAVKNAFERNYACLGVTCAEVGGIYDAAAASYEFFASPCSDNTSYVGYFPGSVVTEHAEIDLDQRDIVDYLALATPDYTNARNRFEQGGNSLSSSGSFRTIMGFSTNAQERMYNGANYPGVPYKHYEMFYNYYGDFDYANKWVLAAFEQTSTTFASGRGDADFSVASGVSDDDTRKEAIQKGTSYMHVWMYAIREFEDAIDDCEHCTTGSCNQHSNYDAVHAWDEGVAFYAGSLEGPDLGGNSAGQMPYRLAEKRCVNFRTCGIKGYNVTGGSQVNHRLHDLFIEGKLLLDAGSCSAVRTVVDEIVSQMTIPLIQGTLRYAHKVDSGSENTPKAKAEGAVFAASVLPLVYHCDTLSQGTTAETIYDNMKLGATSTDFAAVKNAFERNYGCLGVTCYQVGGLYESTAYLTSPDATPCSDNTSFAGYWPGSVVTEHAAIDLDQKEMEDFLDLATPDYTNAQDIFENGGNSLKSSGSYRTIMGFSTNAEERMYNGADYPGVPYKHYEMFYNYYGDFDYANRWVLAAFGKTSTAFSSGRGDANFSAVSDDATRIEAITKGTSYMHVWMYAIREFEDAIDDCEHCTTGSCNQHSNYDAVHAWDEGVAFYAGSLEGPDLGGNSAGLMPYRLAEKRCANFRTCGRDATGTIGISRVNYELHDLFIEGKLLLDAGTCAAVRPVVNQIVSKMTIPLIQGTLRYAFKVHTGEENTAKAKAEGAVFAASVLPLVYHCDTLSRGKTAETIYDNMKLGATTTDFAAVKNAFERNYACLGVTCAEVGGLYDAAAASYEFFASPCSDNTSYVGYFPGSVVTEHAEIDLDQRDIVDYLALATPDYTNARNRFEQGGNSLSSSGSFRTIKGFSTNAQERMYNGANYPGVPYKHYSMFYNYYGDFDYANKWVLAAFEQTSTTFASGRGDADFSVVSGVSDDATRIEAIKKGTSYMHVWMYAIREFEDAIDDCEHCTTGSCNQHSNYDAVHAWDEGVAFYAGSLEGPDLGGNSAGEMPYRLAEKRCVNFRTCGIKGYNVTGGSQVNHRLHDLFIEGKLLLDAGSCSAVRTVVDEIVSQMTIPLIQGTLRYAHKVDSGSENTPKAKAEGAVFAASVLPLVYHCDTLSQGTTAETIYDNMKLGATSTDFAAVKNAFERNYGCLGVTCYQVGGLYESTAYLTSPDATPCSDNTSFVGYWPGSVVTEHAAIDLDQKEMEDFLDLATPDYTNAQDKFENGGNSVNGASYRTIKGFSTKAEERMYNGADYPGVPYKHYSMFYNYYGDFDYANKWVLAAFGKTSTTFSSGRGDANFSAVSDDATRIEAITKGTSYMHVWMYAIREFEDAIDDCEHCTTGSCNQHSNYDAVHAWDEGVAFYAGSLEGPDLGGNSAGLMPYRLAEKRCANFRTCGRDATGTIGISRVNYELHDLFIEGKLLLDAGTCAAVRPVVNQIVSKMTIPLIQGTLRYAFKVHTGEENTAKAKAEGAVFAASVLPLVYHCDTLSRGKTAETIYDNMKLGATTTDFAAVKNAFERNYACLGVTCAEVGGLYDAAAASYEFFASPCSDNTSYVGYFPGSVVTEHAEIDLDQRDIVDYLALATPDYTNARNRFEQGGNSLSSSGSFRTIKGFSTNAQERMYNGANYPGVPYKHYSMFYNYYGDFDYANKWVLAAFEQTSTTFASGRGDADFSVVSGVSDDATRIEAIKKGTSYMHVWMYAIREFEDAIDDCEHCTTGSCNQHSNYDAVHAWDEGVAFYAGSLEGPDLGGNSAGEMPYRLAEKRCVNFRTCGIKGYNVTGGSQVNHRLHDLFIEGKLLLDAGSCSAVRTVVDEIVSQMTIPLIQGTLRYAHKVDSGSENTPKAKAEGAVFAASVLPLVYHCDTLSQGTTAETIYDNMKLGATSTDFAAVKNAFERNYGCLGVTCYQVGGLYESTAYLTSPDATPCSDNTSFVGYWPGSVVTEHAAIDLDQKEMEDFLDLATPDYTNARAKFENGGNSLSSSGSYRTIKGFSTNAEERMYNGANYPGVPYKHYSMFYTYYGDFDYANKWVLAAFEQTSTTFSSGRGNADFSVVSDDATRIEAITKGTSYMHVWMYAIREFEDAIDDCDHCTTSSCNLHSNYDAVHAWDEGVAFYAGSLEGTDLGGDSAGLLPYRLAEKRCANFRTCGSNADGTVGISKVNYDLNELFNEGQLLLDAGKCASVRRVVDDIVSKMTVPLIQGTLRYAFYVDSGIENTAKAKAEGAVFAAAVLPLVHHCSATAAESIYENMRIGSPSTGFSAVKNAFESTYSCLGITCAEVGGLWDANDNDYHAFASPCTNAAVTFDVTMAVDTAMSDFTADVRTALIAEFARITPGVEASDVSLAVAASRRGRRLAPLEVIFTVVCGNDCSTVAAAVPSTAAEGTAVFQAVSAVSSVAVTEVDNVFAPPPPPAPPTVNCVSSISPPPPAPPVVTCSESKTDNAVILGMGVPLALVALASLGFSCLLVSKEKTGKPLFLSLANGHTNGHNGAPNSKV